MYSLIAAGLISLSSPAHTPQMLENLTPTVNLSAIRQLRCFGGTGSGSIIGDGILMTALHVAENGDCKDVQTGVKLTMYYKDVEHDLALMSGDLPKMPPIRIGCGRFQMGGEYSAYGISGFFEGFEMFRQINLTGTGIYSDLEYADGGGAKHIPYLKGYTVFGMSGGPIHNRAGYALGNVIAGLHNSFGIPVGKAYSYEFKDTVLCPQNPNELHIPAM